MDSISANSSQGIISAEKLAKYPPGTILSAKGNKIIAAITQMATGGPVSHNAILTRIPGPETRSGVKPVAVAEIVGSGSRLSTVDEFLKRENRISAQIPPKNTINPENEAKLYTWVMKNTQEGAENLQYSITKAIHSALGIFKHSTNPNPSTSYCTEFVGNAAKNSGYLPQEFKSASFNPNTLPAALKKAGYSDPSAFFNGGIKGLKRLMKNPPSRTLIINLIKSSFQKLLNFLKTILKSFHRP